MISLSAEKCEDGVSEGEDTGDHASHRQGDERAKTDPQKVQPHTPTGNRFGQGHFTLSYELITMGRIADLNKITLIRITGYES